MYYVNHTMPTNATVLVRYDFNEGAGTVVHDSAPAQLGNSHLVSAVPQLLPISDASITFDRRTSYAALAADASLSHGAAVFDHNGAFITVANESLLSSSALTGVSLTIRMALPMTAESSDSTVLALGDGYERAATSAVAVKPYIVDPETGKLVHRVVLGPTQSPSALRGLPVRC